ncbi:hypothetical protein OG21DRAFT_1605721 [Imleria badia]|nr:hypothetical protein OG21DRAFT_1605721 [Imleria badia]
MRLALRTSASIPAPIFITLLTVLLTVTPQSVRAQPDPPIPSTSTDDPSLPNVGYIFIPVAAILGVVILGSCCTICCSSRDRDPDVEKQPTALPGTTQGQGQGQRVAAPAPPPQARTKGEVLSDVGAANEVELDPDDIELAPPPYYPKMFMSSTAGVMRCTILVSKAYSTSASPRTYTPEGSHNAKLNHIDDELGVKRWRD